MCANWVHVFVAWLVSGGIQRVVAIHSCLTQVLHREKQEPLVIYHHF